jgi:signal transduction histidine kinase/DNA-binding response OmpR family regulator
MLGPVADVLGEVDRAVSDEQRERLDIAYRNGLRLQKLVNTLLDFSRIEAGRVQASYEAVDLARLTAELASNFRSACERAGIELVVDCPNLDEPSYVDPDMWEKIVLNLVSNAFKFTLTGSIEVTLRKSGEQVELKVSDTGVGIPPEELPRVFERFHRVPISKGRTQEGSGIGLALVRELVKLHGGNVTVASTLEKGTTFIVRLPRGKDHLPQERINAPRTVTSTSFGAAPFVSEALRWLPAAPGVNHDSSFSQKTQRENTDERRFHILLADDNADMRDYVSRLLSDRYDVRAVADGQVAWSSIQERVPDLILSDVMMPVLDGFELLRRLRSNPKLREIPVVLLSARAGEEARIEGLEAAADDYIVKPFSARELLATVDAHLKTINIRQQSREVLAKQNKRLAVLWEAAGVLLTNEDPDTMLRGLFEKIRESLSLDVYFNFMVSEAGDALELVSTTGIDQQTAQSISRLEFGQAVCGTVAMRRQPIVATHIQQSSEPMVQLVKGLGLRTYACNPLIAGGELLGTLSFASRRRDSFNREEIEFLETISHYVTLAYERLRLIKELREQDQRKDEFLATLAHELRNPLAPIRNALELTERANGDPAVLAKATTIMHRQIDHMVRLVDDLLDVARISRNKLELRKQQIDLESVVRNAVETSRPVLAAAENELHVELPSEPVLLEADPVRLAQVFSNLLNNAAKYSEPGGSISLIAKQQDGELTVRVSDTGIGIEPGQLTQIFGMFVQLDAKEQQVRSGLGVGLTLVQRLIAMHGGSIEARSEGQGKGSEFIVRLPVSTQAPKAKPGVALTSEERPQVRRRILVVDDNLDSAESMAMMLELSGHDVATAHDGVEAIELAREFQPHVALLDIGMPKLDGYEAARSIRGESWGQKMMLVALTGWGQSEDKRRSREAGFDAHLVKPIDFEALEELVASGKTS